MIPPLSTKVEQEPARRAPAPPPPRAVIAAWRTDYDEDYPHGSLGQLTRKELAESRQQRSTSEAA